MKTTKYIAPQIDVVEIEIESAILDASGETVNGVTVIDILEGNGRY